MPCDSNIEIEAALEIINAIYDAHPEAIEENRIVSKIQNYHQQVQSFIYGDAVQYLVGLGATTLEAVDRKGNTALHLACRGAKYETIALLLDKYDDDEKLPWESNEVLDRERESVEYYYGGGISSTEGLPRDYEHWHWCKDATFIGCLPKSEEKDCSQ
eukprot:scaffold2290_cov122-Skeletonema_marinoi.AAC.1